MSDSDEHNGESSSNQLVPAAPLSWWERLGAAALGLGSGVAGGIAIFATANQAGASALVLVGGAFTAWAVMPIIELFILVGAATPRACSFGSSGPPLWHAKNGGRMPPDCDTGAVSTDVWATLDELLGLEALADQVPEGAGIGRLAFYGRCSTEDNQDPRTSWSWQLAEATRFVEPLGGEIVSEYFDIGQSRSLPWERRDEASRLLAALKDPNRGWDGLVVGEATRCWYSNQFSLTWPKFDRHGVSLWIPSLGGRFDPENTVHDMAMTITGGLSKSERQHVQRRVRAAMAAQVVTDGRYQGGRAPYGYVVVDAGPHPNPRKAQEGYRLRVLAIDNEAAPVVERIFALYLDGLGQKAIAETLNR